MAITLADTYFLKAQDNYPWELEEMIENLNYALSYDEDHAEANCLMARFQAEQLNKYSAAEYYFETALASDPLNLNTCKYYSNLLIELKDFNKAHKLIEYALKIRGVDVAIMKKLKGLIAEQQKDYVLSVKLYMDSKQETYNNCLIDELNLDIERVKNKHTATKLYNYNT